MKRLLVTPLVALSALLLLASPAHAHAALGGTDPAAGAVLDDAPTAVTLRFTDSVQADDDAIRLFDAAGDRLATGGVTQPDRRTVSVALGDVEDGAYIVAWNVVSEDGHPIRGAFTWRVGGDTLAVDDAVLRAVVDGQRTSPAVGVAFSIVRVVVFASLLVLVGGALFVSALWPAGAGRRRVRRLLWASLVSLAAATVLGIALQSVEARQSVSDVLATRFGDVWLMRLVVLVPAGFLLVRVRETTSPWWRGVGAAVGLVLIATPALSGHADSGRWPAFAKPLDVAHVAAAAVWLGGIAVLLVGVVRRDVEDAEAVASRFSRVAFGAVVVVAVTGAAQSLRQVNTLDAIETPYGRFLAVKVVLVLTLVGIASLTRSALRGRLAVEGEPISVLRRLVTAEVVVAVAVVAMTALLVDADPTAASRGRGGPFDETVVVDDVIVHLVVVPGTVGPTDLHVYVDDPAGGLTPPEDAVGALSLPAAGISDMDVPFVTAGPSHWSANDVELAVAGDWELVLDIILSDGDSITAAFTIPIGGSS